MSTPAVASAAASSTYTWTFPGSPIRVKIPLSIVARLRTEIDEYCILYPNQPAPERGGVLIGRLEGSSTLHIDDYVWVSSEQPGTGSIAEQSHFDKIRKVDQMPVGYFRTQPEETLRLRNDEIDFFGRQFPHPSSVALLVSTSSTPYKAGFFFWMKEDELSPVSFMDFTLNEEAAGLHLPELEVPPVTKPEKPAIGEKEDEPEIVSEAAARQTQPKPVKHPSSRVVDDPRFPPTTVVKVWKLDSGVSFAGNHQPEPLDLNTPHTPQTLRAAPAAKKPVKQEKSGLSERTLIAGIFFTVLALTATYAFLRNDAPPAVKPAAFPLQLNVEARGDGLNIWWNPQSAAIVQAREGRLVILEEPAKTETIRLDEKQLASGHLYYKSSGERIQLQLEIVDRAGKVSKESVFTFASKAGQERPDPLPRP